MHSFKVIDNIMIVGQDDHANPVEITSGKFYEEYKRNLEDLPKKEAELKATEYQRFRKVEYPSIGDQLDALFHAGVFPPEMAAQIQAVKDKYPKGS